MEVGDHERAVLGFFVVGVGVGVGVGGREVNAGAAFKGCEECGSNAHPKPPSQAVQLLVG